MYLEELIEVAIGLIFVWLIMSMAALQAQEIIASLTKKRSKDLSSTIRHMIDNDAIFAEFYEHPLIKNIKVPANGWWDRFQRWIVKGLPAEIPAGDWWSKFKARIGKNVPEFEDPAYIPASTFATIIFDVVAKAGTPTSPIQTTFSALRREVGLLKSGDQATANALFGRIVDLGWTLSGTQADDLKQRLRREIQTHLTELGRISVNGQTPLANFTAELTESINSGSIDFVTHLSGAEPYVNQIRRGAMQSGSIALGRALNSLLAGVEDYASGADKAIAVGRNNVEDWFDHSMDRLSSWYKRWAQAWLFGIGFFLALVLNVDSIGLANHLWREPAVRQALAANAADFVQENSPEVEDATNSTTVGTTDAPTNDATPTDVVEDLRETFKSLNLPVGWVTETQPVLKKADGKPIKDSSGLWNLCPHPGALESYDPEAEQLYWNFFQKCILFRDLDATAGALTTKLLGIILTALATLQGAPLWFDLLKKLINVRNTGINPADKPKSGDSD